MITFRSVAEYKVVCDQTAGEVSLPFPYCSDSSWGIDMYASFIGSRLVPDHRKAVVFCPDGRGSVSLRLADSDLRLYARLVREGLAFDVLKSGVTIVKEDGRVLIEVRLPEPGEYGLEVFVNDPGKDGKLFAHFCQYLFTADTAGSFASAYRASQALHDEAAEVVDAEEVTAESQSADVEEIEETEGAICTEPTTETVVICEQGPAISPDDQAGVGEMGNEETENGQQAVEEVTEVEEEVSVQQAEAASLETCPPVGEQEAEKAEEDRESVEAAEQMASEETGEPEIEEEVIVASEKKEAESMPVSELEDVLSKEPEDQADTEEVKGDEIDAAVPTQDEEAESEPANEMEDEKVVEEPKADEAGVEEEVEIDRKIKNQMKVKQ